MPFLSRISLTLLIIFSQQILLYAESAETPALSPGMDNTLQQFGQMIFALIIVLGLIVLLLKWVLPSLLGISTPKPKMLAIVDRLVVDQKSSICLLKAGERYHLIGISDMGVNYLTEMDGREVPSDLIKKPNIKPKWDQFMKNWRENKGKSE